MSNLPKCKILEIKGDWSQVRRACMTTIGKDFSGKEPSSEWKKKLLLAEHSPIRKISVCWYWPEIPYAISTHFVRHHVGCAPWVKTSREDRTLIDRATRSQMDLVSMEMEANLQSIINISRKRLCVMADKTTRVYWESFLEELKKEEPEVYSVCVPECVRCGGCPEYKGCGLFDKKWGILTTSLIERYEAYHKSMS